MTRVVAASARSKDEAADTEDPRDRRGPFRPERLATARERMSGPTLVRIFRGLDALVAAGTGLAVAQSFAPEGVLTRQLGAILPIAAGQAATLWALTALSGYAFGRREGLRRHFARIVAASVTGAACAAATAGVSGADPHEAITLGTANLVTLGLSHAWSWGAVRRWRRAGRLTPNIVVVGATPNAERLIAAALETREVNVLGIFDDRSGRSPKALKGVPVLGDTSALIDHKTLPFVDRVVITVTSKAEARVRDLIDRLRVLPNAITLFIDMEGEDTGAATLSRMADAPLTLVSGVHEDERRAFWKRVQDLVIGTAALVVATPVMLAVAAAIRLDSPGPVIFRQRREGFNNETITVLKFRSMRTDATDHNARRQVEKNDDRVTRVGRFIRRTSLDELPQLINVLRGEMSLVGPRPHAAGMITAGEESRRIVEEYSWRHRMKPGLTGWAQIKGSRGAITSREEIRRRVVLDVEYIERQSFALDLYIILMTIPCLLGDRSAVR